MKYFDIAHDVTSSVIFEHLGVRIVNPEYKFEDYDADEIDIAEICIKIEDKISQLGVDIDIGYDYNTRSRIHTIIDAVKTNMTTCHA